MTVHHVSLAQFIGKLGKLPDDLENTIKRGLRSAALRGVSVCVEQIGTHNDASGTPPAIDEGTLQRAVEYERIEKGGSVVVDAPHAAPMEEGTRPFWPPLQPLVDWAQRKFSVDESEARRIAYAVRGKIAKEGLKPRHYMARTVDVLRKRIVLEELERELKAMP